LFLPDAEIDAPDLEKPHHHGEKPFPIHLLQENGVAILQLIDNDAAQFHLNSHGSLHPVFPLI
jgi:hypothetical protein